MKPSLLKNAILAYLEAGLPVYIHSNPGLGKSDIVRSVHKEMSIWSCYANDVVPFGFRDIRASQLDAVDTRGLPTVKGQQTFWNTPSFWPTEGSGIIFLDELTSAMPATKAALYQLILDRCLGDYQVPEGWHIIAAGNLESDNAIVTKDGTALSSRFAHLYLEADVNDWLAWAYENGVYMPLIAFIKFRPELLHKFDPKSRERSFPCPRTVFFLGKLYNKPINPEIELDLVSGIVGAGFAADWLAYHRIFKSLPKPELVLKDPMNAPIPDNTSVLFALCGSIARQVKEDTIDDLVKYISRIPQEFSILTMRQVTKHNEKLKMTPAYISWSVLNQDVMLDN